MRNIKKSVPYKTSDKSWYYQHCLEETYKIFLDISQVIISHDIVINRNAAPLEDFVGELLNGLNYCVSASNFLIGSARRHTVYHNIYKVLSTLHKE